MPGSPLQARNSRKFSRPETPKSPTKAMPKAACTRKKAKIVLTPHGHTTYSMSVRNITYKKRHASMLNTTGSIIAIVLIALHLLMIFGAALPGCTAPKPEPARIPARDPDGPTFIPEPVVVRGCPITPNGHKALNSVSDKGELQCKTA